MVVPVWMRRIIPSREMEAPLEAAAKRLGCSVSALSLGGVGIGARLMMMLGPVGTFVVVLGLSDLVVATGGWNSNAPMSVAAPATRGRPSRSVVPLAASSVPASIVGDPDAST